VLRGWAKLLTGGELREERCLLVDIFSCYTIGTIELRVTPRSRAWEQEHSRGRNAVSPVLHAVSMRYCRSSGDGHRDDYLHAVSHWTGREARSAWASSSAWIQNVTQQEL